MKQEFYQELVEALGPAAVLRPPDIQNYLSDMRGFHYGDAEAVLRPSTTQEVARAVKICRKHRVPVVPQGGNTGLCGGALPEEGTGAVVISLQRMNRILDVDPLCYTITVEAGVVLQAVHDSARAVDREFSMDWGARGSAMIGGGISTNGGGINVLRYGTTREQVLGLEVVLPDGTIWDGLRALRKDASGYDLKQLFIGGEGTLGIVTKACLKLHPRQHVNQSLLGAVAEFTRLMDLFVLAKDIGGHHLSAFELLPGKGVRKVSQIYPAIRQPLETEADWCVLVRFSGSDEQIIEEQLTGFFDAAFTAGLLSDGSISQSLAQEENLWHLRDEIPAERLYDGHLIKWDISVPTSSVIEFVQKAEGLLLHERPQGRFYVFGHVGDGNLHTMFFPGGEGEDGYDEICSRLYGKIDQLVWSLGGSICAEHGVGTESVERLAGQKSEIELELMRKVKNMFDPDHLMNPGKLLRKGDATEPSD
ncbi:MAG: FAD-binding oxidoreductase [Rhizobiaceae bacterium]